MLHALRDLIDGLLSIFQARGGRTPEERRRLIRVKCDYEVACIVGNRSFPAKVVDMGLNGLRLEAPERLRQGTTIYIHHPKPSNRFDNEHVMCQVKWCRRRKGSNAMEVGVQYADTPGNMRRSWVKFLLKELGFDERAIYTRRKAIRAPADLEASMHSDEGGRLEGKVVNLGVGGALFAGEEAFSPGLPIRMQIGPYRRYRVLEVPGTIISTRRRNENGGYLVSVRFNDPTPSQIRLLGDYVIGLLKDSTA
ncbi:MAG: PilZ domain-containing protein [Armatimonadetes bacterium]|nr:PilZ domain-containing protein [Armatimonadota bacterium]